jgi:hypothetical protein
MADLIKQVTYFYLIVDDKPGEGLRLFERLKTRGVNLIAFTAFPYGSGQSQLDFFPESAEQLIKAASQEGITLVGPKKAFLIQGEDKPGALVEYHQKLAKAGVNVHAGNAVTDGTGRFGYIFWAKPGDFDKAANALGV